MVLMFASGFAGLVYQVLWMKQLGLLFGNTAHATSMTFAAFFAGLGAGSWLLGKRTTRIRNPLRLYAGLELGIALTALIYFAILKIFHGIYPSVHAAAAGSSGMLAIKFGLSLLLISPPAFFMGGTVPVIGQVLIRRPDRFGKVAAFIYGINTLGAAAGVASAAFLLVPTLGFRATYVVAVLISLGVAAISWWMSRGAAATSAATDDQPAGSVTAPTGWRDKVAIGGLCFFSGFAVLALEVVWTRIFAQVHENSVYSFAIILTVVLICLALGAGISSIIARLRKPALPTLGVLMALGGLMLTLGPSMVMGVSDDLQPVHSMEAWGKYVAGLFKMGFGGIGLVVIALGTVFPYLMKAVEREAMVPGRALGNLLALNTLGAIVGALLCGFVMLPALGMWGTMKWLSAAYLAVALLIPYPLKGFGVGARALGVLCLLLLLTALDPTRLPSHGSKPGAEPFTVLKSWEGGDCTVSVIERKSGHRAIQVNGGYSLGSTAAYLEQANQARVPLCAFPDTESICFIGMGTGMSAGATLDRDRFPKIKRVVSCELTAEVVEAAREYIPKEMNGGIFDDPRSTILIEDGRHYLMASEEKFDMINADLFLPYRRGAGSLYSLDHYRAAAERLNDNGVFVQWLPLYQLTEFEFGVITRTMLDAFEQVTLWRNNFLPGGEKVALIGQRNRHPLPVPPGIHLKEMRDEVEGFTWQEALPEMVRPEPDAIMFFYAGNVTAEKALFDSYPINTDDKPVIEYQTPRRFRDLAATEKVVWFVGPKLTRMIETILRQCPVTSDPMLEGHPDSSRRLVIAGAAFHQAMIAKGFNRPEKAQSQWEIFQRQWKLSAE